MMGNERRTEVKDGVLIVGDAPGGNYRAEVIRQGLKLPPGRLYHVDIAHDEWCAIWSGRECDCDPDIVTRADGPLRGMASGHDAATPGRG